MHRVLGSRVDKASLLGYISDPFGNNKQEVLSRKKGIIIAVNNLPLVNRGDALFHIASFGKDVGMVEKYVGEYDGVLLEEYLT